MDYIDSIQDDYIMNLKANMLAHNYDDSILEAEAKCCSKFKGNTVYIVGSVQPALDNGTPKSEETSK